MSTYLLKVLTGALPLLPLPEGEEEELDGVLGLKLLCGASYVLFSFALLLLLCSPLSVLLL